MTLNSLTSYGKEFQIKVISSLLTHKEFLTNVNDIISDEDFESSSHKWIIKEIIRYYEKYHTVPTLDILKAELQKIDNDVLQISIKDQLKQAYVSSDEDLEYVQEEFTNFCRNQQLKKALMSSVDLLKAGDYDSIKIMIENALKAGHDKHIGHEYIKDIEERYRKDSRTTIETPWNKINTILQGGLGNGDFGLIFGNPGGGKSWSLVSIGGHAVKMGYNVLHYTLELGEEYVGRRYDAFFTNISVSDSIPLKKKAEEIFVLIEKFAQYGFNKSHSAAYAYVAYQTAWLKVHHTAEFMSANLTSEMRTIDRVVILINECKKININVIPPNINISYEDFRPVDKATISYGLNAIKNVGSKALDTIISER